MDPRIQIRIRIHPKMSWIRNTGQNSEGANVPQTFHKRSKNVLTSIRKWNHQIVWVCSQICPHRKSTEVPYRYLFNPGEQILVLLIKTISVLYKTNSGTIPKRFWFRFQNDIGTFLLSFPTLLLACCRSRGSRCTSLKISGGMTTRITEAKI